MTHAASCRFLDHTLSAVEHGEVRLYEGTIISFQRSSPASSYADSVNSSVSPRSMSDLHTLVTFTSTDSTSTDDALTAVFCFHDTADVGVVFETAHELSVVTKLVKAAARKRSSSSASHSFVHLKYEVLEDVSRFLHFAGSPDLRGGEEKQPVPFPHTRLDFLRLASNRSVQCKLSSTGDSRIELSCDGVKVHGVLCGSTGDGSTSGQSLSLRQSRQLLADMQLPQQSQPQQPTRVVILSDLALYVTENNGRVCGRIALADITELVHMPEASALFIVSSEPLPSSSARHHDEEDGGHNPQRVVGGSVLVSRFCPDIFTRMSMSGRLVRCLPPQAPLHSLEHIATVGVGFGIHGMISASSATAPAAAAAAPPLLGVAETPQHLLRIANEEREIRERHEQLLLAAKPAMCDFATQTESHQLLDGAAAADASGAGDPGEASPSSVIRAAGAETLYWMNQAERLQAGLSRRDVELRLAHERYEALAATVQQQQQQKQGARKGQQQLQQDAAGAAEMQRELEVLRHYSRLLEEEIAEFNESQLQQRIVELSKELMSVRSKQQQQQQPADAEKGGAETDDLGTVEVLRTALRDSQRHQAMVTRKCDRLQAELQSVMINTDAALKELTTFVATIVQQMQEAGTTARSHGGGAGSVLDVPALVQDIVAELHSIEGKVQSEAAVKVAELKALNASLVIELRAREQELERLAADMEAGLSPRRPQASTTFQDAVAQNAADGRHRAAQRGVADLQQVRDRLVSELQHMFEGANAQKQLRALQERVSLLERMHQFPLLINRVASLEAVAAQCEAAKAQAKAMRAELDDKSALLAKRGSVNSALQAEMDALRKRAAQLEQAAGKEAAKREEAEKKAADAATAHQGEVKELRKQVRYHQVRVQELLKRVNDGPAAHVDPASTTTIAAPEPPAAAAAATPPAPVAAPSTSAPLKRPSAVTGRTNPSLSKLDQNTVKTASAAPGAGRSGGPHKLTAPTSAAAAAAVAAPVPAAPAASPSPAPAAKKAVTPPRSSPVRAKEASPPAAFGVVEDPVQIARTRFSQVAARRTSPMLTAAKR